MNKLFSSKVFFNKVIRFKYGRKEDSIAFLLIQRAAFSQKISTNAYNSQHVYEELSLDHLDDLTEKDEEFIEFQKKLEKHKNLNYQKNQLSNVDQIKSAKKHNEVSTTVEESTEINDSQFYSNVKEVSELLMNFENELNSIHSQIHDKRFDIAFEETENLLKKTKRKYTNNHPYFYDILSLKAYILVQQCECEKALQIYNEILEFQMKFDPTHEIQLIVNKQNIANTLKASNKIAEALEIYKSLVSGIDKPNNEEMVELNAHIFSGIYLSISLCLQLLNQIEEAQDYSNKAVKLMELYMNVEELPFSYVLENEGHLAMLQNKPEIALVKFLKALDIKSRNFEKSNPEIIALNKNISLLFRQFDLPLHAMRYEKEILNSVELNDLI